MRDYNRAHIYYYNYVTKSELIEALLTGMISILTSTSIVASFKTDSKNSIIQLISMLTAIFVCLSSFFIKILRKYSANNYWSDRDEELLSLLHLIELNAEALGFEKI